jgi:hypothetical protein
MTRYTQRAEGPTQPIGPHLPVQHYPKLTLGAIPVTALRAWISRRIANDAIQLRMTRYTQRAEGPAVNRPDREVGIMGKVKMSADRCGT